MPDISMCKRESCPIKKECYRYTAKPSPDRQSYLAWEPGQVCDNMFWSNEDRRQHEKETD
jgi:hypothetical protein